MYMVLQNQEISFLDGNIFCINYISIKFKMKVNLWFKSSVYVTSASDINLFSNILDFPAKIWVGMGGEFCATPASDINLSSEIFPIPLKGSFPLCQPKQRPHRQQNKTMLMLMHFGVEGVFLLFESFNESLLFVERSKEGERNSYNAHQPFSFRATLSLSTFYLMKYGICLSSIIFSYTICLFTALP